MGLLVPRYDVYTNPPSYGFNPSTGENIRHPDFKANPDIVILPKPNAVDFPKLDESLKKRGLGPATLPSGERLDPKEYASHWTGKSRGSNEEFLNIISGLPSKGNDFAKIVPPFRIKNPYAWFNKIVGMIPAVDRAQDEYFFNPAGRAIANAVRHPKERWDNEYNYRLKAYLDAAKALPNPKLPSPNPYLGPWNYMKYEGLHPFNWRDIVPNPSLPSSIPRTA